MGKRIVAVVLALCLAASSCVCLAGCSKESDKPSYQLVQEGMLTVALSPDFPPFDMKEGDNLSGFDVSIAREIASRLGLGLNVVSVPFDEVVQGVHDGTYDVALSGLSINPSRSELVDFSSPYYLVDQAIIVKNSSYEMTSDLKGKRVAAQVETTGYDYAKANVSESVVGYDSVAECFEALEAGEVAGIVADAPSCRYFMKTGYSNCNVIETAATCEKYAVAVNKNNRGLTDAINDVLDQMDKDGTLKALQDQVG